MNNSSTILNTHTKKVWKLIVCSSYVCLVYIYIYIYIYIYNYIYIYMYIERERERERDKLLLVQRDESKYFKMNNSKRFLFDICKKMSVKLATLSRGRSEGSLFQ